MEAMVLKDIRLRSPLLFQGLNPRAFSFSLAQVSFPFLRSWLPYSVSSYIQSTSIVVNRHTYKSGDILLLMTIESCPRSKFVLKKVRKLQK